MNQEIEKKALKIMEEKNSSFFGKDYWMSKLIDYSLKKPAFRNSLFRFVDVLPCLQTDEKILKSFKEYLDHPELPKSLKSLISLSSLSPKKSVSLLKENLKQVAYLFITGKNFKEASPKIKKTLEDGYGISIDLLGESVVSEKEAFDYKNQYLNLIDEINQFELSSKKDFHLSIKLSSLYSQTSNASYDHSISEIRKKLDPIFEACIKNDIFLNIDMEQYEYKNLSIDLFKKLLMDPKFKNKTDKIGLVLQAYLKDSFKDLNDLIDFSNKNKLSFSIRWVKGAYWDYEMMNAQSKNWDYPVFRYKHETDINFEKGLDVLMKQKNLKALVASHHPRSLACAITYAKKYKKDLKDLEFQVLYGMGDHLKKALKKEGVLVREYMTLGDLIPGMSYLVRRLLENTSNQSFLKMKFFEKKQIRDLVKDPRQIKKQEEKIGTQLKNHPPLDFSLQKVGDQFQKSINELEKKLPLKVPAIIKGKEIFNENLIFHKNPCDLKQNVSEVCLSDEKMADEAIDEAFKAFKIWSKKKVTERCLVLEELAHLIDKNRYELSALEVLEVGKSWEEADHDITEAIDFCKFYAKQMKEISSGLNFDLWSEKNRLLYKPKGVCVIISPWNFPIAILTGMITSCLVTGNTIIVKPAEQSSLSAYFLFKLLLKTKVLKQAIHFLPGKGEIIGDYLAKHPDISLIHFTGSKEVGLQLMEQTRKINSSYSFKKLVCEMGGKNALIIDEDADLDEACKTAIYSCFYFQGQKCSAASRLIVLESSYENFKKRFIEAVKSLKVGNVKYPEYKIGALIDETSFKRSLSYLEKYSKNNLITKKENLSKDAYFIPPSVLEVKASDPINEKELFSPIVSLIKVKDLEEAIQVCNQNPFGLTAGIFSRNIKNIKKASEEIKVGNFYINRSITGAMVERQPFGGLKLSGLGSKTGYLDYLKQFMDAYTVSENRIRRGSSDIDETKLIFDDF